jgi:hypothetical protein
MNSRPAFMDATRCCAKSKRTGRPCQAPAVRGWRVCRFHGAGGGAPKGKHNGAFRTGLHTEEMRAMRRELWDLICAARTAVRGLRDG